MKLRSRGLWSKAGLAEVPNDKTYLIGVSGGRDSMVLLDWLLSLGYDRLIVCHFEHGLRGRAGKDDARFVERIARKHGLRFESGAADVACLAAERKQSIETTGRQERLSFFQKVGKRHRCRTIFLAHQADDQVETFLLNLFRGAGGRGLGAMRPRSILGSLEVVRPFLGVWRAEIDRHAAENQIPFREDATNKKLDARRNRLRHRIVPLLEKEFGRNIRATIWRTATILAEEDDFLARQTPVALTNKEEISRGELRRFPTALQRRILREWLGHCRVGEIGFEAIEGARMLLTEETPAKINLAHGRHLRRRAGKLFLD
jgi:tRNA(Ile)-lysidine synthase